MIIQRDEIPSFIPDNPRAIFLGTMCALNARTINGQKPNEDFFYYNDNRNHFWKILQYIYDPNNEPQRLNINEKKSFLTKHQIGIQNLVYEIQTPNNQKLDPSDTILFECFKKNRIVFKELMPNQVTKFTNTSLYFTCRYKKGIHQLLEGFLQHNRLNENIMDRTWYLKTPTRCNPFKRSQEWIQEMKEHIKSS